MLSQRLTNELDSFLAAKGISRPKQRSSRHFAGLNALFSKKIRTDAELAPSFDAAEIDAALSEEYCFEPDCDDRESSPELDADCCAVPEAFPEPMYAAKPVDNAWKQHAPQYAPQCFASGSAGLDDYITNNLRPSFSDELLRLIDKSGKQDSEIYNKAGIDRRHFSKIRSRRDYHPGKSTVVALCLALRLPLEEAQQLLSSAGYSLSDSDVFDLIVRFCLSSEIYALDDVNAALCRYDQKPLGVTA